MISLIDLVFVGSACATFPIYSTILFLLIYYRKGTRLATPFYGLIISQGFADILYLSTYVILIICGYMVFADMMSESVNLIVANVIVRIISYCLALRCLGITFISIQRYITICWWTSSVYMWLNKTSPVRIFITHWLLAAVVSSPILLVVSARLGPTRDQGLLLDALSFKPNLSFIVKQKAWPRKVGVVHGIQLTHTITIKKSYMLTFFSQVLMAVSYVSVFPPFFICFFCYAVVLRQLFAKRYESSCPLAAKREFQLCIQVAAFVFAYFLLTVLYAVQSVYVFSSRQPPEAIQYLHPLMSGLISIVIPWTLLFFNQEVSTLFKKIMGFESPILPKIAAWSSGVRK